MKDASAWSPGLLSCARDRWSRLDIPGSYGRLIRELSWDKINGRGQEDVLTTEVFQALDFLPRDPYLTAVWRMIHDISDKGLNPLLRDAESARFITLPGEFCYNPTDKKATVQPDVIIESSSCVLSVEAKRPLGASFDPTQLARQALLLSRIAPDRPAYLWVILGEPPPIKLGKLGKHSLIDALRHGLGKITDAASGDAIVSRFGGCLGWSTWSEIVGTCRREHRSIAKPDALSGCTERLVSAMENALSWHASA